MKRMHEPQKHNGAFKPIGLAIAAVVASAAPVAAADPAPQVRLHAPEAQPAADEQDDTLLLGPSAPVEPFSKAPAKKQDMRQGNLFEL